MDIQVRNILISFCNFFVSLVSDFAFALAFGLSPVDLPLPVEAGTFCLSIFMFAIWESSASPMALLPVLEVTAPPADVRVPARETSPPARWYDAVVSMAEALWSLDLAHQ